MEEGILLIKVVDTTYGCGRKVRIPDGSWRYVKMTRPMLWAAAC
jgi:hypothetical protein